MNIFLELSCRLLQITQAIHDQAPSADLDQLSELVQQRTRLLAELDIASQQEWPDSIMAECRLILEKAKRLEIDAMQGLSKRRDKAGHEHHILMTSKKARQAYGEF